METEYLIQKKIISGDMQRYYFPIFAGPVSEAFANIYKNFVLDKYNIELMTNMEEISKKIKKTPIEEIKGISMSHSQFIKDSRFKDTEYKGKHKPNEFVCKIKRRIRKRICRINCNCKYNGK